MSRIPADRRRTPRPSTPDGVADLLAEAIASWRGTHPLRVAIDGAPPTEPGRLAAAVRDRLPPLGRPVVVVDARTYLRPASLRLERGRTDPDAFYEDRLDAGALQREVLDPAGPGGDRRVLTALRDPDADRPTRAEREPIAAGSALLVFGAMLLGAGLPFDLTVHLRMTPPALQRRTPAAEHWTLPAYARYEAEVGPATTADMVVFADDPQRPAVLA